MCDQEIYKTDDAHFIHLLLEVYCGYGWHEDEEIEIPEFCKSGIKHPGYHCLENNCQFKAFTYADNEICYAGELGEVPSSNAWIGFGGDMESQDYNEVENQELISLWEKICQEKIAEAFDEFMKMKTRK